MNDEILVDKIVPSPYQPRLEFDLEDLKGSVLRDGMLVPITVRRKGELYELIDGERRTRLARELGMETIPATIIDVDDDVARRMVWKVNTLRKDYKPQEKARYFKNLQEEGMSLKGIARECDYAIGSVKAYLNVLSLPKKYQKLVWNDDRLSVTHIQEMDSLFNGGVLDNTPILQKLDLVLDRKLTSKELREVLRPELKEIEEQRVEAAQKAAKTHVIPIMPTLKEASTPEELNKIANILKKEAKRKEKAQKTPEQLEVERQAKEQKKKEQAEKRKQKKAEERKRIERKAQEKAEKDAQRKLEEDRKRLAKQAEKELEAEKDRLKNDPSFIRQVRTEISPPIPPAQDSTPPKTDSPALQPPPLKYITFGVENDLFYSLTDYMKKKQILMDESIVLLLKKGLEAEGYEF